MIARGQKMHIFQFMLVNFLCFVGNPDGFHSNYLTVMDFIKKLEAHMADYLVGEFRASKLLQNFIHRWNLPVYFQIRFQEIGGPVEEACQGSCDCRVKYQDWY